MKFIITLSLVLLLCSISIAQEGTVAVKAITLKDGSKLIGQIIKEDEQQIRFKTSAGVEMEIKKDLIEKIEDVEVETPVDESARRYQVGDHELLIMPTAYTMEKGQSYFSDYELFFINYAYAPTNTTHLSAFTLFPITSEFTETFTLGIKQKYLDLENFKAALWGSYTPKPDLVTIGTVFSIGSGPDGLHLAISTANSLDRDDENADQWEWIYMVGYRADVSTKIALIAEYTNFSSAVEEDFNGLISLGVRFRGESNTWDLAGVRPLESTGDFILFPLLKATFLID